MVQLDCFSKGPLRVPNSSDGAKQLAALLSGTEHKAVLATLMMLGRSALRGRYIIDPVA